MGTSTQTFGEKKNLLIVPTIRCAESLRILNAFLIDLLDYQVHHQASIFLAGINRTPF